MMAKQRRKGAGKMVNLGDGPELLKAWTFYMLLLRAFYLHPGFVCALWACCKLPGQGRNTLFSNFEKARGCYTGKSQGRHKLIETLGGKKYFSPQKDVVGLALEHWEGKPQILLWNFKAWKPMIDTQ